MATPFPMMVNATVHVDTACARACITGDEPYLAGHFPGWPVVPGVLLLKLMRETAGLLFPEQELQRVEGVRFLQAVTPGAELVAEAKRTSAGQASATLKAGDAPVARCKLHFSSRRSCCHE